VTAQIFPGPKPYEEHQHYLFFGRKHDVEAMVNKTRERLGVLSAESGAGKSSLLEAGYIPTLRKQRAAKRGVPPVLLLRSWGGRKRDPDERILEGAKQAIDDLLIRSMNWENLSNSLAENNDPRSEEASTIARSIAEDHRTLRETLAREMSATPVPTAFDVLKALCEVDGLILILDQFEEFMGSASAEAGGDWTPSVQATHAVGRLFRDLPKIRIIISLRTEYCQRLLRDLNKFVVNLQSRVINLLPLPPQSILQIVEGVSGQSGQEVEAFALSLALAASPMERDATDGSSISVIEMQALLFGFERWCKGAMDFTTWRWNKYEDSLRVRPTAHDLPTNDVRFETRPADVNLGRIALANWVADQLDMAICGGRGDISPSGQRARWLLLPVLPRLSTHGGYKQHLPLRQLVLDLADRLSAGYGQLPVVKERVRLWMDNDYKDVLRLESEATDSGGTGQLVAPFDEDVDPVQCIKDFLLAIDKLQEARLLKLSGNGADRSCELIHDGLSEHVRKWSDDLPNSSETTLGCPVRVVGESFGWRRLGDGAQKERRLIEGKKWIGCTVNAEIRNVRFKKCEFGGLAFSGCSMENVIFEDCILPGAVTLGGEWKNVVFRDCTLKSALFRRVRFGGKIEFQGSIPKLKTDGTLQFVVNDILPAGTTFNSATPSHGESRKSSGDMQMIQFEDCRMLRSSEMEFRECVLRFAMIGFFENDAESPLRFARCDMMNAWVEDAGMPSVVVDEYCRTIGLLSFELPTPAWLERRKS